MASSGKYKLWQKMASDELDRQKGKLPDFCYWSSQILIPASKTKADLDNLPKGIHDLLVKNERVPDDRYNVSVTVQFWRGDHVVIAVKHEETKKWARIKKPSKSLLKRLTMNLL